MLNLREKTSSCTAVIMLLYSAPLAGLSSSSTNLNVIITFLKKMQTSYIPIHLKNYTSHIFYLLYSVFVVVIWTWIIPYFFIGLGFLWSTCPESQVIFFFSWPLTELGMCDFRQNKFEISSIYVWSCKAFWQTALLQQCLTKELVNDAWYKQCADRIPCCWERLIQKQPQVSL